LEVPNELQTTFYFSVSFPVKHFRVRAIDGNGPQPSPHRFGKREPRGPHADTDSGAFASSPIASCHHSGAKDKLSDTDPGLPADAIARSKSFAFA
jgi:hypothetical protein